MEINPGEVRSCARHVLVDEWGVDVTSRMVEHFKTRLQTALESLGYKQRIYTSGSGIITGDAFPLPGDFGPEPEAIAYIQGEVPFRNEPVLIDDVGNIYGGFPVLKVAVRDANGTNKGINELILKILQVYGISSDEAKRSESPPPAKGTIVYALRRDTDNHSEDEGFQYIDDVLDSLGLVRANVPMIPCR